MVKIDSCEVAHNLVKIIQDLFQAIEALKNIPANFQNLLEICLNRLYMMSVNKNTHPTDLRNISRWYSSIESRYNTYVEQYATRS